jgi:hypothetical protein
MRRWCRRRLQLVGAGLQPEFAVDHPGFGGPALDRQSPRSRSAVIAVVAGEKVIALDAMPEPAFEDCNPSSVAGEPYFSVSVLEEADGGALSGNRDHLPSLRCLRAAFGEAPPCA